MAAQGAELKLRVSLDLTTLRRQLNSINTELGGQGITVPIKLGRTQVADELRRLNTYLGSKKYNVEINTNLESEIKNAGRLVQALRHVQSAASGARGTLPIGTAQLGRTAGQGGFSAAQIKSLFSAAIQGGLLDERTLGRTRAQMVAALGSIGRDSIEGLLNGLSSGDAQLRAAAESLGDSLIAALKTALGIASPSKETGKLGKFAAEGFEKGFISGMVKAERTMANAIRVAVIGSIREGLGNLPGLGRALVGFERQLAASVQLAVRRAMREGMSASIAPGARGALLGGTGGAATGAAVGGAKALGGGIAGGVAKLTAGGLMGTAANLARYSLDSSAYQEFVGKLYQEIINSALSSGSQGAIIGALAVGGVAGGVGFARGATGSLAIQAVTAIRNRVLAALLAVSTGEMNSVVKVMVRDVTATIFTGIIRQLRNATLGLPAINWPAIAPTKATGIGPSGSGRLLPAGADPRMLGAAAAPAGLLPGISQTTARRSSIATGLERIFEAGGPTFPEGPSGKLALTPEALKRRVDAILAEYFKVVEVQIRDIFAAPALPAYPYDYRDLHWRVVQMLQPIVNSLETATRFAKEAGIDRKVDLFFAQISSALRLKQEQIAAGMPRPGARTLPAPRGIAGLLPPAGGTTPPGATRFNVVRTGDVVPPQQLKLPPGRARVLGEQPFMTAPSIGGGGGRRPPGGPFLTQGSPGAFKATGADVAAFTAGAEKALRYEKALEVARASLKDFRASQLPLVGGLKELGGEFAMATKQVLLYGTAYRGLAFVTALPGQIINAAKSQQQYNNALKTATQDTGTFGKELLFVDNVQRAFGLNLETTRSGFTRLYASMAPANFDSGSIEKLFTGISAATAALQLTPDKAERVIYAFGQMASKGQIMSEELKGQLGDVLPGALAIFAKAAGMSVKEFSKAMEDGAFVGSRFRDVFAKVSDELINRFGTSAQVAGKSLQGLLNTVQGDFTRTLESLAPLADTAAKAVLGPLSRSLKQLSMSAQIATGEIERSFSQLQQAQQDLSELRAGGASADQIKAAEQNVAALTVRYKALQAVAQDPAIAKQAEDIQKFTEEIAKAGTFVMNLASTIGNILSPILNFLGSNLTTVISIVASLVLGFQAARLATMAVMGAMVLFRAVTATLGLGAVAQQAGAVAAGLNLLGVSASRATVQMVGLRVAMTALVASTVVGAVIAGIVAIAGAFATMRDRAKEASQASRDAAQSAIEAAQTGNVAQAAMSVQAVLSESRKATAARTTLEKIYARSTKGQRQGVAPMAITPQESVALQGSALTSGLIKATRQGRREIQVPAPSDMEGIRKQFGSLAGTMAVSLKEAKVAEKTAQQVAAKIGINKPAPMAGAAADVGTEGSKPKQDKAAKAAERLAEQTAQQAQAAADALFNEQQRLAVMQATNPTAKALAEYASQELVIQRELNQKLKEAKSEKERQDFIDAAAIQRKQNALTLDQELARAREQAMQPLEDALKNQREQLLVEADIKRLVAEGMVPERAKEVAEIRKLTRAALEQIDAQIAMLDKQIEVAKAALLERQAREGSTKAVQDMIKALDELEKRRKKAEEDKGKTSGAGAAAEAGVPPVEGEKKKSPTDFIKESASNAQKELEKLTNWGYQVAEGAKAIGSAFGQAFKDIASGSKTTQEALASMFQSIADHFFDMAAQIIAQMLVMYTLKLVLGLFGGGGGFSYSGANHSGAFGSGSPVKFNPDAFKMPKLAAEGAYWSGGFQAFANGGFVSGPTLGLVGEGSEAEYIIPASKMRSAMNRYASGARGSAVIPGNGEGDGGPTSGLAAMNASSIDVRYTVERINSVDYVTADQFRAGMAQAAQQGATQGEQRTLRRLQQSRATRSRLGMN